MISVFLGNINEGVEDNDADSLSPRKLPKTSAVRTTSHNGRNSLSSSSSSVSSSTDDEDSADSELEENKELLKEEYQKCLREPKPNALLSNSF